MKTINLITTTALIGIAVLLIACNSENNESDSSQKTENSDSQNDNKEEVRKILSDYLAIKNALTETDGAAASSEAKKLLSHLNEIKTEEVEKIRTDAEHISATENTDDQRAAFNTLSQNVYTLVKATEANASTLYKQYCPMAFDNEGAYWLSSKKEIANPYFGDKMLRCGKVEEEL